MKETLTAGLESTKTYKVGEDRCLQVGKNKIYVTSALLTDVENTCADLLKEHLEPGETSVGTRIELEQTAPTPLGMSVKVHAQLRNLNGRLATFEVYVEDDKEPCAKALHSRFIVNQSQMEANVERKVSGA